jgi:hypothetical protein
MAHLLVPFVAISAACAFFHFATRALAPEGAARIVANALFLLAAGSVASVLILRALAPERAKRAVGGGGGGGGGGGVVGGASSGTAGGAGGSLFGSVRGADEAEHARLEAAAERAARELLEEEARAARAGATQRKK